jgi:regulatory protein
VALALLARRDHTAGELRQKLRVRGFTPDEIEEILPRLRDTGLVDDRRTARLLLERETAGRGTGPALLRAKLIAKGVAPGTIDECLGALTGDWELEQAKLAAARWSARHPRAGAWKEALARHLRSRGFGWGAVRNALGSTTPEHDDWRSTSHDEP